METGPLWRAAAAIRNPVSRESGPGGDPRVSGVSAAVSRGTCPAAQTAVCAGELLSRLRCAYAQARARGRGSMLRAPMRSVSGRSRGVLPSAGRAAGVRWVVTLMLVIAAGKTVAEGGLTSGTAADVGQHRHARLASGGGQSRYSPWSSRRWPPYCPCVR